MLSGTMICGSLAAEPLRYHIDFTLTFGSIMPTGSFDYDAEVPLFSNFVVEWNGFSFDLTESANAPTFRNYSPQDCTSELGPNPATGFALMIPSACVIDHYSFGTQWVGNVYPARTIIDDGYESPSRAHFEFAAINAAAFQAVGILTDIYDVEHGPRIISSAGVWVVTPAQVSEPDIAALTLTSLIAMVAVRRSREKSPAKARTSLVAIA